MTTKGVRTMKTPRFIRTFFGLPLVVAGILTSSPGRAQEACPWHFSFLADLFMSGVSGDVTVRGNPAKVNASFGDLLDHLEFGADARLTLGYEKWWLSTEISYTDLGGSSAVGTADFDQWLVEPTIGYSFSELVAVFAGVRYNNLSAEIRFSGPLGVVRSGTQQWYDPIIGTLLSLPLLDRKLTFDGRFDVGGFDVGSKFTWQAFPYLNWHFSHWGSLQLGYRWLGTDYENGSGANKFVYDVVEQGPQIGLTVRF
jgi:hypothetical protein